MSPADIIRRSIVNISEFRAAGVANADPRDANSRRRMLAAGFAAAALVLGACAIGNVSKARPAAAPAALQPAEPQVPDPKSKKESTRAPVTPVPAEFRTPEQAARHAADPKTSTGAIVIKPPINVMPPDTPPSDPKQ